MELVGKYIKKARLKKKINLKTVASELNISLDLIKKIENDEFTEQVDKTYLIGYIRTYAKLLGLNEDYVIKQFKFQNFFSDRNFFNKLPKPLEKNSINLFFAKRTFAFFSIIFISFTFYFLFIKTNDMQPEFAIIPDLPVEMQSTIEQIEINSALNNAGTTREEERLSVIDKNAIIVEGNLLKNESSAVASIVKDDQIKFMQTVTLKFLNPTWIQLRNKQGDIVFSKLMNISDQYSYSIEDNLTLTAGNAGNVIVLINDDIRGKIGKKGEVIESLIINSDFNN